MWFDQEAREASSFYCSIFPDSGISNTTELHDTPSGDVDSISFDIWGYRFMAISAGPVFKFNPAISFVVNFDPSRMTGAREKINEVWDKLSPGGTVRMPLGEYPFSKKFGWLDDKYGLSWQLILSNPGGDPRPPIVPSMLFVGENCGRSEVALNFYLSVFENSQHGQLIRYPAGMDPEREGTVMFADFMIAGQWFSAMDSARDHQFNFNEAVSFIVNCETQQEIDYYWEKLSAVPEAEQCGWLKDKFGVSWQIVPVAMGEMTRNGSPEQIERVTKAFLAMKKFDLAGLYKAFNG